ncbi:MAG: GAF and ANTAR domain-containing protein [bacterium]
MKKTKKRINQFKQIEVLSELSKAITSDNYLKDILGLGVTLLSEILNTKICSLMLIDEKNQELSIKATQSMSGEYLNKPPLKIGEGIVGRVVLEKKPVGIMDVTKEKGYHYKDMAVKEGLKSMLSMPLLIRNKAIGVLNCYTSKLHKFTNNEINLVALVANQLAIVIDNTQLMLHSKLIEEELESRKLIERAKGILMSEEGLSEDLAYKKMQKYSMDTRKSMKEIARAIITTNELKR